MQSIWPFRNTYQQKNFSAVLVLIGLNIIGFLVQQLFSDAIYFMALNPVAILHGYFWQFFTYMFAHGGISHLFFNMFALFIFGIQVERIMGSREFIIYYLLTGLLAGAFSFLVFWLTKSYHVFLLGASGAVFAVQLAFAVFFPRALIYIMGIIPVRAPLMVLGFTAIELFSTLTGYNSSVAHLTHLAGFGFGWLYILIRFKKNPWKELTRK
jgi:membrane associated rhomboid family serine protease